MLDGRPVDDGMTPRAFDPLPPHRRGPQTIRLHPMGAIWAYMNTPVAVAAGQA
jgi:hypothetical protein